MAVPLMAIIQVISDSANGILSANISAVYPIKQKGIPHTFIPF